MMVFLNDLKIVLGAVKQSSDNHIITPQDKVTQSNTFFSLYCESTFSPGNTFVYTFLNLEIYFALYIIPIFLRIHRVLILQLTKSIPN